MPNHDDGKAVEEKEAHVSKGKKSKVKYASKEELMKVAKAVKEFNMGEGTSLGNTDGYFTVYRKLVYDFNLNLVDENGEICSAIKCAEALNIYLLMMAKRQESNNGTCKMDEPELEGSCYLSLENIAKITRIRLKTVYVLVDILALNGYIIRKIKPSNKSNKPKYFFYVLNYPNKALVQKLSDEKISFE